MYKYIYIYRMVIIMTIHTCRIMIIELYKYVHWYRPQCIHTFTNVHTFLGLKTSAPASGRRRRRSTGKHWMCRGQNVGHIATLPSSWGSIYIHAYYIIHISTIIINYIHIYIFSNIFQTLLDHYMTLLYPWCLDMWWPLVTVPAVPGHTERDLHLQ